MKIVWPIIFCVLLAPRLFAAQSATDEKEVWSMEDSYWRYVHTNDLENYRTLWHSKFLGWPLSSPEPVSKQHITDWITAHTSTGETLKSYSLERLMAHSIGNCVTVTYRVGMTWITKDGVDRPGNLRVIHTWLHDPGHKWQIISGMAASPNAQGH